MAQSIVIFLRDNAMSNENFSTEVVQFIQETVHKDSRWMAIMVKAVYEKYGHEAVDLISQAIYVVRWDGKTPSPSGEHFSIIFPWTTNMARTAYTI